MPASDARGRNSLPGSTTASPSVTGISNSDTTSVVGWPITSAGDIPIYIFPILNLEFRNWEFFTTSCVFSEIGIKPSMNSLVIRGISSITAPIVTPKNRIFLMSNCAKAPIRAPTITPNTSGSPSMPNFFFSPSASISSFENPGIMSSPLFTNIAIGVKLCTKGWGIEMPSMSL